MNFSKKTWIAREGVGLNNFSINGSSETVTLVCKPESISEKGTSLSAANLNNLESRIADAINTVPLEVGDKGNERKQIRVIEANGGDFIPDTSTDNVAVYVTGGIVATSGIRGQKVYNAVWNDLADCIEVNCKPEPGYCYSFDGKHYNKSSKYLDKYFIGIHSDTYGFSMGHKENVTELNVAVAGFVLAYVDKHYEPGTPLTCTKDGKLTAIKPIDRILHPERVIATFWKPEYNLEWGPEGDKIKVNGRQWVKIK